MRADPAFTEELLSSLTDKQMRPLLEQFAKDYKAKQKNAFKDKDFDAIRQDLAAIKNYAVENMAKLAADFEDNAKEQGAIVYRARNAEDACQYIVSLAKEKRVKKIIKTKSLISEEIQINSKLEAAGLPAMETDMASWLLQLLGERPSHPVLPALHLTKEEAAKLLSAYCGHPVEPVIKDMAAFVRKELRQAFFAADMSITGANLLAADSGSVFILSNEGNDRMAANLPHIQVVLAGYDKLSATLDECFRIIDALPKSAVGQQITGYVTMLTGNPPYLDSYGEKGKELHIVLVDNGRLRMQRDPRFREALRCIQCGACLNVCPLFPLVGGQVFGNIHMGPIGSIYTAFTDGLAQAKDMQALCIGCGRCRDICPADIDLPDLIMNLRRQLAEKGALTAKEKLLFRQFLARPILMKLSLSLGEKLQKPLLTEDRFYKKLPLLSGSQVTDFPALAKPLAATFKTVPQPILGHCDVAIFGGCLVNHVYPQIGEAMAKVLNHYDTRASHPPRQACCGAPAYYKGDIKSAQKLIKTNIEAFEKGDFEYILTPCPTCTAFIKEHFEELMPEGNWRQRARKFQEKTGDFTSFICLLEKEMKLIKTRGLPGKITYHDPCHYKRGPGFAEKPRYLLSRIAATREMEEADSCCGFGGAYVLQQPEISKALLEKKCRNILASRADIVATDCPGCLLQISGGLHKQGSAVKVKHTAELLADYFG